ncbi:FKBP-type peptidyl-prolyl cis-trans isomerase [Mucilaginibacter sp. UR6-1]|uniref:FKBP-type peptidyl-prolyl cis-trans isomerase n=1 Tax=Mucilaginibacter sp. UR6-1 TaxID=1435643 RepID=UPI001E51F3C9|nr:FKBP-type peptidyl-prolyl cis-trans isomerase [Mucilaginibacter sp. UR6-1]MCC8408340.1 FKBP-type peptidyl-prolyl cis-trans isomerase [Mucilaginibacter sp. UR6-1]
MKKTSIAIVLAALSFSASAQVQRTAKGAECTIVTKNNGPHIKEGDIITFQVEQLTDKDSVLFSTYKAGKPVQTQVRASQSIMDLMDVFTLLGAKDSALVKLPVDSVFKGHEDAMPAFLKKGSNIITRLKIEKVQSLAEAMAEKEAEMAKLKTAETTAANKYITDNKLTVATTPSGLKYVIKLPSARLKPKAGDTMLVNYVGRTLDGKVFDSSIEAEAKKANLQQPGRTYEPIEVVQGEGRVIKGWEEGLALLGEGSKATLIIPSALGYGERGSQPVIMPYSTLVFDVELVKVKPGKKAVTAPVKKAPAKKVPVRKKTAAKKAATSKKAN